MKIIPLSVAIVSAALSSLANAVTINVTDGNLQPAIIPGNTITFDSVADGDTVFGGTANEVTVAFAGNTGVQSGSVSGQYAEPVPGDPPYLSVGGTGSATFTFANPQNSLGFLWGSVDTYNQIEFYLGAGSVFAADGSDIRVPADGNQEGIGTKYVTFSDIVFDSFRLYNNPTTNAFELDNVTSTAVPDGGATVILLGFSLLGLAYGKSKRHASK